MLSMPLEHPTSSQMNSIRLHPLDNVVIVTRERGLTEGDSVITGDLNTPLTCRQSITRGQKIATRRIQKDESILKFGNTIGVATRVIETGEHVHTHNVKMPPPSAIQTAIGTKPADTLQDVPNLPSTFQGYPRTGGMAGVRNYIVVVASVNCSATVVKAICRHFWKQDLQARGIDGIIPVCDPAGCAQTVGGTYHKLLNRTIAGWMFHPNVVGSVVIGLGCEAVTVDGLLQFQKSSPNPAVPVEFLTVQDTGGTAKSIQEGIRRVDKILAQLPSYTRQALPVSQLRLALNCGGSDAFSSLTANPALGFASDFLVSRGASVALAEIPECHGAEQSLKDRAISPQVKHELDLTFQWWEAYARRQNISLNNNLSPGNIAGGITTIIEKSLGAVAKGGRSTLSQVVDYAQRITEPGLVIMNTPGYDPVSVTGLVAGGCQLVAFTTGRGSVYGCAIAPTIKISSTSELFSRLSGDMDEDAGVALTTQSTREVGTTLYRSLIAVASGRKTCSEQLGLGWEEFMPWAIGETL